MSSTSSIFSDLSMRPEDAFHAYGTAERLAVEIPALHPSGDATEAYRLAWGFYCTGESGAWTLSSEHVRHFLDLQRFGDNLPLRALFEMVTVKRTGPMLPPEELKITDRLLERIRARRAAIQARRGLLTESYLFIRQDREA